MLALALFSLWSGVREGGPVAGRDWDMCRSRGCTGWLQMDDAVALGSVLSQTYSGMPSVGLPTYW
jgi:hypothetical protein